MLLVMKFDPLSLCSVAGNPTIFSIPLQGLPAYPHAVDDDDLDDFDEDDFDDDFDDDFEEEEEDDFEDFDDEFGGGLDEEFGEDEDLDKANSPNQ